MCVERQTVRENQSGVKVSSVKVSKTFRSVDSSHLVINIYNIYIYYQMPPHPQPKLKMTL